MGKRQVKHRFFSEYTLDFSYPISVPSWSGYDRQEDEPNCLPNELKTLIIPTGHGYLIQYTVLLTDLAQDTARNIQLQYQINFSLHGKPHQECMGSKEFSTVTDYTSCNTNSDFVCSPFIYIYNREGYITNQS